MIYEDDLVLNIRKELRVACIELRKYQKQIDLFEERGRTNYYGHEIWQREIAPELRELKLKAQACKQNAIASAKAHLDAYRKQERDRDALNPGKITDDIKLLQSGITLTERDLDDMLNRNADNRTMQQLICRYADEHKIQVNPMIAYHSCEQDANKLCDSYSFAIDTFEKYMQNENYLKTLNDFLPVPDDCEDIL